jgi:uncharacterized membrane protein YphA (DoxX/SURF4 family)
MQLADETVEVPVRASDALPPRRQPLRTVAATLARLVVSGVLVAAAVDKALHYEGFLQALRSYPFAPVWVATYVGLPIILIEIVCGIGLWIPRYSRSAAWTSALLLTLFSLVLWTRLPTEAPCGCWFSITIGSTTRHLALDLMLVVLSSSLALQGVRAPLGRRRRPSGD